MWLVFRVRCCHRSYSPFTCIRSFWAAYCIRITCIGTSILIFQFTRIERQSFCNFFNHCSAVCGRIETAIQGLPPPYYLNKPKFALVTSTETRNQIKAPNFGINWTISQGTVEVVNSLTGKTVNNKISRLTKQVFFVRYANLIKQLRIPRSIAGDYSEAKQAAREYQIAKRELFDAFRREDLGSWLKKPIEQDNFNLPT